MSIPRPSATIQLMGAFDIKFFEALVSAGVPPERAHELVELLEKRFDDQSSIREHNLASKRDLAELEIRLVKEIAGTHERIAGAELKLGSLIAEQKSDVLKWMFGAMVAQTGIIMAFLRLTH